MNPRRVASFVDAVLSDRRPRSFKADAADAEVLRTAITMRAGRPGEQVPDEQFVAHLRKELATQAGVATTSRARPLATRRARLMLGTAAVVTMLGGTVAATTTVERALTAASAPPTKAELLRVGQFESAAGHTVGRIVAYRGEPSWVLMSVRDPGMDGPVRCRIEMSNGRTAATGTFVVHNGAADFARAVSVDIGQFRQATLVSASGSVLATASFPAS